MFLCSFILWTVIYQNVLCRTLLYWKCPLYWIPSKWRVCQYNCSRCSTDYQERHAGYSYFSVVHHNVNQSELFTPLCTFMYQTFGLHIMLLHCFDISSFTRSTGSLLRYQCNYIIPWTSFKSFRQQTYSPKTRIKNTRILNACHCNHAIYITRHNKTWESPKNL